MATQGPLYPGTITSEIGPSGDDDWVGRTNIGADNGLYASITAATFDATDTSYRLKAQNFGFTIPTDATIDGIVVEIEQRADAGAAEDQEVRLYDEAGALVGDDKQTATPWLAVDTIASYGSSTDKWGWTTVTPAKVNDVDFGVAHIVAATVANTDVFVDFIRVTIHYTSNPNATVTPSVIAAVGTLAAPTVSAAAQVAPSVIAVAASIPTPTVIASGVGVPLDETGRRIFEGLTETGESVFVTAAGLTEAGRSVFGVSITLVSPTTIQATTTIATPAVVGTAEIEAQTIDVSADILQPAIQILPAAQKARPDSDFARDTWTTDSGGTTNLWDSINEQTASDADYVKSSVNAVDDELVVTLANIEDPESSTGHVVRYRYRKA